MTREEITAKINTLVSCMLSLNTETHGDLYKAWDEQIAKLNILFDKSISIEDLQREAFDAGRTNCKGNIDYEEYDGNVHLRPCLVKYNTAQDYLNSNENEY